MSKYKSWSVAVQNKSEVHLLLDEEDACEFMSKGVKDPIKRRNFPVSSKIISIHTQAEGVIKIELENGYLNLQSKKFEPAIIFHKKLHNTQDLVAFWQATGDYLLASDESDAEFIPNNINENRITRSTSLEKDNLNKSADLFDQTDETSESANTHFDQQISETTIESNKMENTENDGFSRDRLLESISKKQVSCKFMNIFHLKQPPTKYKVRETDPVFIEKLSCSMIEKNSISLNNAPTVIGLIDMNISQFREDSIDTHEIYIIDGNHSIQAQQTAYRKTKNPVFLYRTVNIYCGLTEAEALFLGISRNEDTGSFSKFSDFAKVDLLRKRLYHMTETPEDEDPPKAPKEFRELFISFLNLKGKKAVCSKNILRFLSTNLSNRCYKLYKNICERHRCTPASKFDCLRGLSEKDSFEALLELKQSTQDKEHWKSFTSLCHERQNKKKTKQRKEVPAKITFCDEKIARVYIDNKPMVGNIICFKFIDEKMKKEAIFTQTELKNIVFGGSSTSACSDKVSSRFKDSTPLFTSSPNEYSRACTDREHSNNVTSHGQAGRGKFFSQEQQENAKHKQKRYIQSCFQNAASSSSTFQASSTNSSHMYDYLSDSPSPVKLSAKKRATQPISTKRRLATTKDDPLISKYIPIDYSSDSESSVKLTAKKRATQPISTKRRLATTKDDQLISKNIPIDYFSDSESSVKLTEKKRATQPISTNRRLATTKDDPLIGKNIPIDYSSDSESSVKLTAKKRATQPISTKWRLATTKDDPLISKNIPIDYSSDSESSVKLTAKKRATQPISTKRRLATTKDDPLISKNIPIDYSSDSESSVKLTDEFTGKGQKSLKNSFQGTVSLSTSVSDFLFTIADENAAKRAERGISVIEEDEVETIPESLIDKAELLLDPNVRQAAQQHFSDDAWLTVSSTLSVLEANSKTRCLPVPEPVRKKLKVRLTDISTVKNVGSYIRKKGHKK